MVILLLMRCECPYRLAFCVSGNKHLQSRVAPLEVSVFPERQWSGSEHTPAASLLPGPQKGNRTHTGTVLGAKLWRWVS